VPLPHRSLFRGVFQVPAGHFLTAGEHGLEVRRYWDLDFDASDAAAPDQTATAAGEPVERFRGALEEAVRTRLRADVPVACYLSGGVDSSAILGLAARHAPRRLRAFTIRFADPAHDESQPARTAAARCGAELVEVPVDGRALADAFEAAVGHGETAVVNAHGVAKFLLSRAVREAGGKVVLTGEGADEMLGGYAHFRRDVARHGAAGLPPDDRNRLARWLRAAEAASAASAPRRAAFFDAAAPLRAAVGFVPSWLEAQFGVACRQQGWLADGFARRIAPRDSFGALADALALDGRIRRWEPLHRSLYLYAHTNLPNYVLSVLGDRMEMAHSVEGRVPFLDHRVAELAASLPASSKVRGRIEKYVLREAARPLLTDEAYRRPKHPFVAPPALLDRGALWERMESELRGPALDALPFYDPRSVRQTLDRLPDLPTRARLDLDPALTVAASLCVLQRRFRPAAGES
jgi:asparagine synthase (glutamine-hydrolysing)